MQVTYQLQVTDWQVADRFFAAKLPPLPQRIDFGRGLFVALVFAFVLVPALWMIKAYLQSPTFAAAWKSSQVSSLLPVFGFFLPALLLAALWFGAPLLQGRSFRQSSDHNRQITVSIEKEGLRGITLVPWSQIHSIEESTAHIFITWGDNHLLIVPKRAFDSELTATQFAARCRDARKNASF